MMTRFDEARAKTLLTNALHAVEQPADTSWLRSVHTFASPELTPGERADWFYVLTDAVRTAWWADDTTEDERADAEDRIYVALGFLTYGFAPQHERRRAA